MWAWSREADSHRQTTGTFTGANQVKRRKKKLWKVRQLVVLLEKLQATELELSRTIALAEFESACGKV